jgi:transcriptional regulator with XRE-family HTH domain
VVEPIGVRIRRLRQERGVPQDRLAIEAHVDQSGLSKFERGIPGKTFGDTPLRRIAASLGVSFEELTRGTDYQA